jgi:hypothetical protein
MNKGILSPTIAPPPPEVKPLAEPLPRVHVNLRFLPDLLEFAGMTKQVRTLIETYAAQRAAIGKKRVGLSFDDVRLRDKQVMRDILDGKRDASESPDKPENFRKAALARRVVRLKEAKQSHESCMKLADILQRVKDKDLPKYCERLLATESAVSPVVAALGKTPLQRLCEAMPDFLQGQIDKLREPIGFPRKLETLIKFDL